MIDKNIKSQMIKVVSIFVILFTFISLFFVAEPVAAYASSTKYTAVIDDLSNDTNFAVYDYQVINNDNSLQVLTVAESNQNEIFVYVYNPSADRIASSINISATSDNSIMFNNYKLQLLDKNQTLSKYLVIGLTLPKGSKRYYNISSIYRNFDKNIDTAPDNGNVTTEVSYKIAKEYCIYDEAGKSITKIKDTEVITITDKFVGYVEYDNGFVLYNSACHSHFIAFDTDKPIDKLLEADVYYTEQPYSYRSEYKEGIGGGFKEYPSYGVKVDKVAHLKYTDKVVHTSNGLMGATYRWNRIEKVSDFIKKENIEQTVYTGATIDVNRGNKITKEGRQKLANKKWILRFAETPYEYVFANNQSSLRSTLVGDVTILRLKFDTNGIVYNLGVIDNKTTEPDTEPPVNQEDDTVRPLTPEEIWNRIWRKIKMFFENYWWIVVLVIVGLILLLNPQIILFLLKIVFKIVLLPFTLCKNIYTKIKENELAKNNDVQLLKNSDKACLHTKMVNVSSKKKRGKK